MYINIIDQLGVSNITKLYIIQVILETHQIINPILNLKFTNKFPNRAKNVDTIDIMSKSLHSPLLQACHLSSHTYYKCKLREDHEMPESSLYGSDQNNDADI